MKTLSILMITSLFMLSSFTASAHHFKSVPLSGNYEGTASYKTFAENNGNAVKVKSSKQYDVEILFKDGVFIFQNPSFKCMGKYKLKGNQITFEVSSTKGDSVLAKSFFNQTTYQYSTAGKRLMLISKEGIGTNQVIIYELNK